MGSRAIEPGTPPTTGAVLRASRDVAIAGWSRRQLLRRAVGASVGLWLVEMSAGTVGWLWSAVAAATPKVDVGTFASMVLRQGDLPFADGFPAYVAEARAFLVLVDPALGGWRPGDDPTGEGSTTNVRVLSQRCPHLGCRPNPCLEDSWFHCPCHQSRYDRLGIKAAGETFGPAPRGMDRYAASVDRDGALTIDTGKVTLGPLPVALGAPGLIPPLVANGCVG
jgi:cytochrome b6-f complex iron-sulfur subunit